MKYILAVWNRGGKGKTQTLHYLANHFIDTPYPGLNIIVHKTSSSLKNDFRFVFEIGGKVIAIESQGDPNTNLALRIDDLIVKYKCDTIICATRTRGDTVQAVEYSGYDTIWTSTYDILDHNNHQKVNELNAKHILELLQTLQAI